MQIQEEVRKAYFKEGKSKRQIALELQISRNTVKKLLEKAPDEIPRYQLKQPKTPTVMGPFVEIIKTWLEEDKKAPRKQRHTAKRIYDRLCQSYGFQGNERTVRKHVAKLKEKQREVFLPLAFSPGEMAQVDWGEVSILLNGILTKIQIFGMTLNYSGAFFFRAFLQQNMESFFQGHADAFAFFDGVPDTITYDNLKTAVEKVFKGKNRQENNRFFAFRSAYLFDSRFCTHSSIHIRKP